MQASLDIAKVTGKVILGQVPPGLEMSIPTKLMDVTLVKLDGDKLEGRGMKLGQKSQVTLPKLRGKTGQQIMITVRIWQYQNQNA